MKCGQRWSILSYIPYITSSFYTFIITRGKSNKSSGIIPRWYVKPHLSIFFFYIYISRESRWLSPCPRHNQVKLFACLFLFLTFCGMSVHNSSVKAELAGRDLLIPADKHFFFFFLKKHKSRQHNNSVKLTLTSEEFNSQTVTVLQKNFIMAR